MELSAFSTYRKNLDLTTSWIQTFTGKQIYPLRPALDKIDIIDIAHALSNICRYTGHSKYFYCVGLHSVYVSRILPDRFKMWGLLHDAAEAYLSDFASPIKKAFPTYIKAEERLLSAIATKFGLEWPMPVEIVQADTRLLATEKKFLLGRSPVAWKTLPKVVKGLTIPLMFPPEAEDMFLHEFISLGGYLPE